MEHRVQCLKCNFVSKRQEAYTEFDLRLRPNANIEDLLSDTQQSEILNGENRYRCPQCKHLRAASRSSKPVSYPPVLNLCLMRFTYTSKGRVKRKDPIRYGKTLELNGQTYHLKAVVTHHGMSVSAAPR